MSKILLVDDDESLCEDIADWLTREQFVVEVAHTAELGRDLLRSFSYDLLLLDWSMPGQSGLDFLKEYRASGGQMPILMLTGKESVNEKELGLNCGADDYLTKPFHMRELTARVRALLRRPAKNLGRVYTAGNLSLDTVTRRLLKEGSEVELLPKEYALLEFFLRHPNQVFMPDELINHVWSSERDVGTETVRTAIMRLRKKVDTDGRESMIKNMRGLGYKFEPP